MCVFSAFLLCLSGDLSGKTPLHHVALSLAERSLLFECAHPNIEAARLPHSECVALLLENGADVNARDDSGDTALNVARELGNEDMARLLLDGGADVGVRNKKGRVADPSSNCELDN